VCQQLQAHERAAKQQDKTKSHQAKAPSEKNKKNIGNETLKLA
jgi:hypothetical protein